MRSVQFCLLTVLLSLSSFAEGAPQDKPAAKAPDEAREKLKAFLMTQLKDGAGDQTTTYKTEAGRTVNAKVVSATEEGLKLTAEENTFSLPWEEWGEQALYDFTRAF